MTEELDAKRRHYKRWPLNEKDEHLPLPQQQSGIAVTIHHYWLFNRLICRAVIKDVSFGGAGLLVPAEKKMPNKITVMFSKDKRLSGLIKHRELVSEKLQFLGIEWTSKNEQQKSELFTELAIEPKVK